MKDQTKKKICICGHELGWHISSINPLGGRCWILACLCKNFKRDNLRYLEEKANDTN
jgi:hypothetical protein